MIHSDVNDFFDAMLSSILKVISKIFSTGIFIFFSGGDTCQWKHMVTVVVTDMVIMTSDKCINDGNNSDCNNGDGKMNKRFQQQHKGKVILITS